MSLPILTLSFLVLPFTLLLGCSQSSESVSAERGPIGKTDQAGSCLDSCGAQSPDGCYCDDLCAGYGDCCGDIEPVCGAEDCSALAEASCAGRVDCSWVVTDGFPGPISICLPHCSFLDEGECGSRGDCDWTITDGFPGQISICLPAVEEPALCLVDGDCDANEACDHSECLSGCPEGNICPQVCYGQCAAELTP